MLNVFRSKLIFGKYRIKELIAKGSFSEVYLGVNIKDNKYYSIKIEDTTKVNPSLKEEAFILCILKGPGLPKVITFGHMGKYNILVENLLGKSINQIWLEKNKKFNLKDICMFAFQGLERLEYVHSKNYLHRDIKTDNFLVGNPDSSQIYLIDFGNAKKYKSSRTGKHLSFNKSNLVFGTPRYLSFNTLKGIDQTRKDDLESFGLVLIYLYKGYLPWSNLKCKNAMENLSKIYEIRKKMNLKTLCKEMPSEIYKYMYYVQILNFEQNPDYRYLKSLFLNILEKIGEKNDFIFSWVDKNIKIQKINNLSKSKSPRKICEKLLSQKANKSDLLQNSKYPEKIVTNTDYNCFINIFLEKNNLNDTKNNLIEGNELFYNQKNITEKNEDKNNYPINLKNNFKIEFKTYRNNKSIKTNKNQKIIKKNAFISKLLHISKLKPIRYKKIKLNPRLFYNNSNNIYCDENNTEISGIFSGKSDGKINLNETLITSNYNLTEVNNPNNNGRYEEYLKLKRFYTNNYKYPINYRKINTNINNINIYNNKNNTTYTKLNKENSLKINFETKYNNILESHIRDNNKYYLTEYKQNISRKSSHQFKKKISNLFISDKYKRETTENMIEKNKKSTISICE